MSKKLVIRINNLQDNENDDTYEVSEETIIRWDRVVAVSALALVLLAVVIWGGWQLFSKASSAKVDTETFTDSSPVINSDLDSQAPALAAAPENDQETIDASGKAVDGNVVEGKVVEGKVVEGKVVEGKVVEGKVVAESGRSGNRAESEATLPTHNMPVEDISEAAKVATAPTEEEPKGAEVVSAEADTALVKSKASAKNMVSATHASGLAKHKKEAAINSPDPVVIESARIVKAQLTHRVKNSEPVDKLGSVISMNEDKLIRVYLFTGMEGLKGETLYHDWYLSGKKMARVKIKVKNDKTSASSSKFIDRHMTGDWRVKVTTSRGDELVSASFNVVN